MAGPASDPEIVGATVAPDNGRVCHTSRVAVDLESGTPATPVSDLGLPVGDALGQQELLVKMCLPEGTSSPSAVQVLIHGITYDHRYWNIADPDDPAGDRYTWEAAAADAGYATLALDRIGNGDSTHPPSPTVTLDSNVTAVHQVVQALRSGTVEGPAGPVAFEKVILVGHSYGSIASSFEASRYQDVDALILTGFSHNIQELDTPLAIESQHYPAALDPQFAGSLLDPGYITSRPGTRYNLFYAPGTDVDPRIVERDEATKGSLSQFEIYNFPVFFRTVLDVNVPVFIINGNLDEIFCSQQPLDLAADCSTPQTLVADEQQWFPNAPSLEAAIIPDTGHDLNAFRSSQKTFGTAMDWITGRVSATS